VRNWDARLIETQQKRGVCQILAQSHYYLLVAVDPKHLPDDPQVLQQMVLDLMAQLDREFTQRNKIEALLRELLDAKRNRKSEQLSADQLALFAAAWQARQAEVEAPAKPDDSDDNNPNAAPGGGESTAKKRTGGRQPLPRHLKRERIVHDLAEGEKHCAACQQDLRPIGEESSERYEYIPAQLTVIEVSARNMLAPAR